MQPNKQALLIGILEILKPFRQFTAEEVCEIVLHLFVYEFVWPLQYIKLVYFTQKQVPTLDSHQSIS